MPVEIRELIIKTNIVSENNPAPKQGGASEESDIEKIIEECVRQVMERLKRKNER